MIVCQALAREKIIKTKIGTLGSCVGHPCIMVSTLNLLVRLGIKPESAVPSRALYQLGHLLFMMLG